MYQVHLLVSQHNWLTRCSVVFCSELYTNSWYSPTFTRYILKGEAPQGYPQQHADFPPSPRPTRKHLHTNPSSRSSIDIPPPEPWFERCHIKFQKFLQEDDLPLACWKILRLQLGWKGVSVKSPTVFFRWIFWKILGGPILDGVTCRDVSHIRGFLALPTAPNKRNAGWFMEENEKRSEDKEFS